MPESTYFQRNQNFSLQKDCSGNSCFRGPRTLVLKLSEPFGVGLRTPQADDIHEVGFLERDGSHTGIDYMVFCFFFSEN